MERDTMPTEVGIPVDLRDDGFLWLINTVVFHPRGFALAWSPSAKDFRLLGDGSDRWRFSEESEPSNDDLWAATEAAFERARKGV